MLNVEQFIYTSASLKRKSGYQIVAKSKGITEHILSELDQYLYPIGVESNEFKESRSLVVLKNNMIAYSIIKNIGIGYDGRTNTLYNHTFVCEKNDFEKYNYETRIFDDFYVEDESIRGDLPILKLDPPIPTADFRYSGDVKFVLYEILLGIFNNKKIVVIDNNVESIQKLLSILPKSMRLIPFSTLLIQPQKQPAYEFVLTQHRYITNFDDSFGIIDPSNILKKQPQSAIEKSISFLVDLINYGKLDEVKEIYQSFERITHSNYKNKLILVTLFSQYKSEQDPNFKQKYADEIAKLLNKFESAVASEYLEKIKGSLKEYKILQEKLRPVVNPYMSLIDLFYMPAKIMNELYAAYNERQKKMKTDDDV